MIGDGKRRGRGGADARRVGLMAATTLAGILAGGEAARAACDPAANNSVTATCTGVITNQNNPFGYGDGAFTNLNVTAVPGATSRERPKA